MAFTSSCPSARNKSLSRKGSVPTPWCNAHSARANMRWTRSSRRGHRLIVVHPGSTAATAVAASESNRGQYFLGPSRRTRAARRRPAAVRRRWSATGDTRRPCGIDGPRRASWAKRPRARGQAALFGFGPETAGETDHPSEPLAGPFGEPLAAPLSEEGHDLAAEPAEGGAPWGGGWGEFKEEYRTRGRRRHRPGRARPGRRA